GGRVEHVARPPDERVAVARTQWTASVRHAALVPPQLVVAGAGRGAGAGGSARIEAVQERHPQIDAGQPVAPGGRQQPAHLGRILAQLPGAIFDAGEILWPRLVLHVHEEPVEPATLGEMLDPGPSP